MHVMGVASITPCSHNHLHVTPLTNCNLLTMKDRVTSFRLGEALAPEPEKKKKVPHATVQKWKVKMDNELHTMKWLECAMEVQAGKRFMMKL